MKDKHKRNLCRNMHWLTYDPSREFTGEAKTWSAQEKFDFYCDVIDSGPADHRFKVQNKQRARACLNSEFREEEWKIKQESRNNEQRLIDDIRKDQIFAQNNSNNLPVLVDYFEEKEKKESYWVNFFKFMSWLRVPYDYLYIVGEENLFNIIIDLNNIDLPIEQNRQATPDEMLAYRLSVACLNQSEDYRQFTADDIKEAKQQIAAEKEKAEEEKRKLAEQQRLEKEIRIKQQKEEEQNRLRQMQEKKKKKLSYKTHLFFSRSRKASTQQVSASPIICRKAAPQDEIFTKVTNV